MKKPFPWHRLASWVAVAALALAVYNLTVDREGVQGVAEDRRAPAFDVVGLDGEMLSLRDLRGRPVFINFWATWCAPCRREMPALDRLQAKLGGDDFMVLALSQDRKGPPVVTAFLQKIAVANLAVYVDPTSRSARAFGAYGLPATVLLDRQGRALGRMVGPAEWDSDDAIKLFHHFIAKGKKAADKS